MSVLTAQKPTSKPDPLNPKQRTAIKLLASPALHCLIYGGSRSGKTFLLAYAIAVRAMSAPNSRHLIARLHNIDVRQAVMMDTWPKMMRACFPQIKYTENKTDQFVTFPNGAEVWFGGLDDKDRVDKILGKEFATIYVNESSQVAYATILTLLTRLAQVCTKADGRPLPLKAYYDLNPVGKGHWTYREFIDGVRADNGEKLDDPESRTYAVLNPADNPLLSEAYIKILAGMPERYRKRFQLGEYLTEVPGALWPLDTIEKNRVSERPELTRVVVAVDPSGSDGTGGDQQGIVVAGLGVDGHCYVIIDASCRMSPAGWGKRAVDLYVTEQADMIVAEINFGGAMVESTIRGVNATVNFKPVTASRGKHVRAEPVAGLYEQGKVHHVGSFPELEEQLGMFTTAGFQGSGSPDRADALVWCITELMLATPVASAWALEIARQEAAKNVPQIVEEPQVIHQPGSMGWALEQAAIAEAKAAEAV